MKETVDAVASQIRKNGETRRQLAEVRRMAREEYRHECLTRKERETLAKAELRDLFQKRQENDTLPR